MHATKNLVPVLVELMGYGTQKNLTVKVLTCNNLIIDSCYNIMKFFLIAFFTSSDSSYTCSDNSGVVGGVIAAVLITISMVIIAILIGYIVHLRRHLKQQHPKL